MLPLHGIQRAGINAIPVTHAHVLKNNRWLKFSVDLFHNLMRTGACRCADPLAGAAFFGIAYIIAHKANSFLGCMRIYPLFLKPPEDLVESLFEPCHGHAPVADPVLLLQVYLGKGHVEGRV